MTTDKDPSDTIIIKKYANRRLYDTSASAYVTLDHLSRLVRAGRNFIVQDAKTGDDLTRSVLAQIIFEQENRKDGVLPVSFLRQVIQLYGESFQSLLPYYLEMSMNSFATQQEKWREHMEKTFVDMKVPGAFEAQVRRNMALFEENMRMFATVPPAPVEEPPAAPAQPTPKPSETAAQTPPTPEENASAAPPPENPMLALQNQTLSLLQKQMSDMQKQLEAFARTSTPPTDTKPH